MERDKRYNWQLQPHCMHLLDLNYNYKVRIVEGSNKQTMANYRLELRKKRLNDRVKSGVVVPSTEWQMLEKDYEALAIEKRSMMTLKIQLLDQIEFEASKVSGMFQDIFSDFKDNQISQSQYLNFLQRYKDIINTGNGLKCFETASFEIIKREIEKHLQAKQIINEEIPQINGRAKKRSGKASN